MNGIQAQAQILKEELGIPLSQALELLAKCHGLKTPNELTAQSERLNHVQTNIAKKSLSQPPRTTYEARLNLSPLSLLELEAARDVNPQEIASKLEESAKALKALAKAYRSGESETLATGEPQKIFLRELREIKLDAGFFNWKSIEASSLQVSFKPKMGTVVVGQNLSTSEGPVTVAMLFSSEGELLDMKCIRASDDSHCGEHRGLTSKLHRRIREADAKSIKVVPFYDLYTSKVEPQAFGISLKVAGSRKSEFVRLKGSSNPFKSKGEAEAFIESVRAKAA